MSGVQSASSPSRGPGHWSRRGGTCKGPYPKVRSRCTERLTSRSWMRWRGKTRLAEGETSCGGSCNSPHEVKRPPRLSAADLVPRAHLPELLQTPVEVDPGSASAEVVVAPFDRDDRTDGYLLFAGTQLDPADLSRQSASRSSRGRGYRSRLWAHDRGPKS